MLNDAKKIYEESANLIPNWKDMDKNSLCNLCIDNEFSPLYNSYLSAVILKYWNKIYTLQKSTSLTATYEDTYSWVIEGVLYALKHRRWLDKDSNIYNDPSGPDKAINRKIKCIRLNHLISQNRDKRKIQINTLSLDSFDDADNFIGSSYEIVFPSDVVVSLIDRGQYANAVLADMISNGDGFISKDSKQVFSIEELANLVYELDDDYFDYFRKKYGVSEDVCNNARDELQSSYAIHDLWGIGDGKVKKSIPQIRTMIKKSISQMNGDKEIVKILC